MRILQVLHKGDFNTGSVHQMYSLSLELARRGPDVTVAGRPGSEVEQHCVEEGIPYAALPFRNEMDMVSLRGAVSLLKERRIEVVHVHKGLPHTLLLMATFFAPVPCFLANRGVSFPLTLFNRLKYRTRRCHGVVCVCDAIRDIVIRTGRVDQEKVVTIHAGTDLESFDPSRNTGRALRRELGYEEDDVIICQTGLREWRGWRTLVEAFGIVAPRAPRARLLLAAARDEDHRREIMDAAKGAGVADRTRVLGYRRDMPALSAAQDIGADFSYAGLGITGTLREAMAMERPVVCSSAGGNPELVLDGETGLVVGPKDPEAAAEAFLRLVDDPSMRRSMGLRGRQRVEEGFSLSVRVDRVEALYRSVLDS